MKAGATKIFRHDVEDERFEFIQLYHAVEFNLQLIHGMHDGCTLTLQGGMGWDDDSIVLLGPWTLWSPTSLPIN